MEKHIFLNNIMKMEKLKFMYFMKPNIITNVQLKMKMNKTIMMIQKRYLKLKGKCQKEHKKH